MESSEANRSVSASETAAAELDRLQVGDTASCEWTVTAELLDSFASFSGDTNPLHMDERFARSCGFPGRVAHGMVALSAISRLIGTRIPGPGALWISQDVHLVAPSFLGDQIEARVTVQAISRAAQVVVLHTEAVNVATRTAILRGTAKVHVPARQVAEPGDAVQDVRNS
ncbi:MAG: MaoC family dehydratase [Pirellulaceae bacterium]